MSITGGRKKYLIIILAIVFIVIAVCIISNFMKYMSNLLTEYTNLLDEKAIFDSVDTLSILDQYIVAEIDDPLLKSFPYEDKYCYEIAYNGVTINIYAYDFCDEIDTMEYYNSVLGEGINRQLTEIVLSKQSLPNQRYHLHITSDAHVEYVIYSDTLLYYIKCPDIETFAAFQNWLNEYFTIIIE